jgi:hypothetical protein
MSLLRYLGSHLQLLHRKRPTESNTPLTKNPGPGRYDSAYNAKHGFTMRPKTAQHRNCTYCPTTDFINDK